MTPGGSKPVPQGAVNLGADPRFAVRLDAEMAAHVYLVRCSLGACQGLRRQMTAGSGLEAVDAEDVLHADQRAEQGRPCRAIGPTLLERGRVAAQPIEPIRFGHVSEHVGFACRESAFEFVDPVVQSRKRTLAEQCHFLSFAGAQS